MYLILSIFHIRPVLTTMFMFHFPILLEENTLPGGIAGGVGSEVVPTLASDASVLLFRAR